MIPRAPARSVTWYDAQLGRQPSPVPAHLSRVLHIPHHDDGTIHLPIYEVTARYHKAVGQSLMGSTLFTTMLGVMERPRGDNLDDQVEYLAQMQRGHNGDVQIDLDKRGLGSEKDSEIHLGATSPSSTAVAPAMHIKSGGILVNVDTAYPIPQSVRGSMTISHPYFTLTASSGGNSSLITLEWQIHPVQDGLLRYTLMRKDKAGAGAILAIYHHMGWELSLQLGYSEGVLLLPEAGENSKLEGFIVASLLGVLLRLRMLGTKGEMAKKTGKAGGVLQHARSMFSRRHA